MVEVVVPMSPLPLLVFWLLVMEPPWVAPPDAPDVPVLVEAEPLLCVPLLLLWLASLCGIAELLRSDELLPEFDEPDGELVWALLLEGVVADCELLAVPVGAVCSDVEDPASPPEAVLPVVDPVAPVDC